jgi:hypothetical protein
MTKQKKGIEHNDTLFPRPSSLRLLVEDVGEAALTTVVAVEVVGHEGPGAALGVGALLAEAGDLLLSSSTL